MTARSFYELLGVDARATAPEIHAAYRRLAKEHHPDAKLAGADHRMAELNEAWAVLRDPRARAAYDHGLLGTGPARRGSGDPAGAPASSDEPNQPTSSGVRSLLVVSVVLLVVVIVVFTLMALVQSPTT